MWWRNVSINLKSYKCVVRVCVCEYQVVLPTRSMPKPQLHVRRQPMLIHFAGVSMSVQCTLQKTTTRRNFSMRIKRKPKHEVAKTLSHCSALAKADSEIVHEIRVRRGSVLHFLVACWWVVVCSSDGWRSRWLSQFSFIIWDYFIDFGKNLNSGIVLTFSVVLSNIRHMCINHSMHLWANHAMTQRPTQHKKIDIEPIAHYVQRRRRRRGKKCHGRNRTENQWNTLNILICKNEILNNKRLVCTVWHWNKFIGANVPWKFDELQFLISVLYLPLSAVLFSYLF